MKNKTILNPAVSSLSFEDAEALSKKLNTDSEDDWSYGMTRDPNSEGYIVEVYDEKGSFVGHL